MIRNYCVWVWIKLIAAAADGIWSGLIRVHKEEKLILCICALEIFPSTDDDGNLCHSNHLLNITLTMHRLLLSSKELLDKLISLYPYDSATWQFLFVVVVWFSSIQLCLYSVCNKGCCHNQLYSNLDIQNVDFIPSEQARGKSGRENSQRRQKKEILRKTRL